MSAAETIIVYIDPDQLEAQQKNNYSLYLAKMVNGAFTVIWQSKGPISTVNNPGYDYWNEFQITIPAYQVNYGIVVPGDPVTFNARGLAVPMSLGQTVDLAAGGEFDTPVNGGQAGTLTINNTYAANPNAILCDSSGNTIFVDLASGMDIGLTTLEPIDQYQLWFGSYVDTGTIIANNVSNVGTVTFAGKDTETISYTNAGIWAPGPLPPAQIVFDPDAEVTSTKMIVAATFTTALSSLAVTYLLNKLMSKFGTLKPKSITAQVGSKLLKVEFDTSKAGAAAFSFDKYEQSVNDALNAAAKSHHSHIKMDSWTLSEPSMEVNF